MLQGPNHTLTNTNRPTEYNVWLHRSRKWDEMPDIDAMLTPQYSSMWWSWWKTLQPAWRALSLTQDLRGTRGFDWSQTRKGSQNGLFTVILTLGWWLLGIKNGSGSGMEGCMAAVNDVAWVLDQMIAAENLVQTATSSPLGKRPRGKNDTGHTKAKK